ncbi:hypothetical protein G7Y89_g6112 [Cudoniella acicularis]|uniref:Epoxide hydrolase N-terminal domain-containing protein n=1 Tax=Cudoniella acicularis TaxID=354080 RepID=A0A8H4W3C0_9HELO|nr:hypothetical protein G7Y89_g6112 [Cudoniella acicularis]
MAIPYSQIPTQAIKTPSPFNVSIPANQLSELKALLKSSKIPAPTYESLQEGGRFGVSRRWMTEAKRYWEDEFDWRKCEEHINSFPNFIADVVLGKEEHKIHFVALFSDKIDAIPLILFHGWPGNFMEFLPLLSLMKEKYTPQKLPYHLIVPSHPGYAFSSPPPLNRDFSKADICAIMNQLMTDLGFGSGYIAQGGDIGSHVARELVSEYESSAHVNYFPIHSPSEIHPTSSLTAQEQEGLKRGEDFMKFGTAYAFEHATRPSTIGFVLAASPLALLAWIGEKFLAWSDQDPSLEQILESVTLYWLTETFPTSVYPYRGRFEPPLKSATAYIQKPVGYSSFPKEITPIPKIWAEKEANVVFYREHDKGGHFAALEQPALLMEDVEEFVKQPDDHVDLTYKLQHRHQQDLDQDYDIFDILGASQSFTPNIESNEIPNRLQDNLTCRALIKYDLDETVESPASAQAEDNDDGDSLLGHLESNHEELPKLTCTLEGTSIASFRLMTQWLYSDKISLRSDNGEKNTIHLVELWILAGKFLVPRLQNYIMRILYDILNATPSIALQCLDFIYSSTEKGSMIRKLVIWSLVDALSSEELEKNAVKFPRGYLLEFVLHQRICAEEDLVGLSVEFFLVSEMPGKEVSADFEMMEDEEVKDYLKGFEEVDKSVPADKRAQGNKSDGSLI